MEARFSCKTNIVNTVVHGKKTQPSNSFVGLSKQNGNITLYIITSKSPDTKWTYNISKRLVMLFPQCSVWQLYQEKHFKIL